MIPNPVLFPIYSSVLRCSGAQRGREFPILGGMQVSAGEGQHPLKALPASDPFASVLVPQGMEGSPKEEVFLGAFQFQPENIIQMFPLQVPEKGCLR